MAFTLPEVAPVSCSESSFLESLILQRPTEEGVEVLFLKLTTIHAIVDVSCFCHVVRHFVSSHWGVFIQWSIFFFDVLHGLVFVYPNSFCAKRSKKNLSILKINASVMCVCSILTSTYTFVFYIHFPNGKTLI
jgi:hypothetical protein